MKRLSSILTATLLAASHLLGAEAAPTVSLSTLQDPEVVKLFSTLPVQEMGRVKPLDTIARFKLLRFSGKQSSISATRVDEATGKTEPILDPATSKPLVDAKGKAPKFSAIEWLLVSWFRPDIAKELRVFVVDNSEAIIELGLTGKGKRDRYTYNEVAPGRELLMQKMKELRAVEAKDRTPVQRALGKLSLDFLDYEMILSHFDFARAPFGKDTTSLPPVLKAHIKDGKTDWTGLLPAMTEYLKNDPQAADPMSNSWMKNFYVAFMGALMSGNNETLPRYFPPPASKQEVWHNPGMIIKSTLEGGSASPEDTAMLNAYGSLASSATKTAELKSAI